MLVLASNQAIICHLRNIRLLLQCFLLAPSEHFVSTLRAVGFCNLPICFHSPSTLKRYKKRSFCTISFLRSNWGRVKNTLLCSVYQYQILILCLVGTSIRFVSFALFWWLFNLNLIYFQSCGNFRFEKMLCKILFACIELCWAGECYCMETGARTFIDLRKANEKCEI